MTISERIGGGWACSTGKKMFTSRRQAKGYMKRRPKGNHRRCYRCTECAFWHVTSADAATTEALREGGT